MYNSYIKDICFHVPPDVITNDDLAKVMDTSDEWITTRTGIQKRHTVKDSKQGPADLAVIAAEKLIVKQNINKEDIDFVVFATSTPDRFVPGSGSMFQDKLGLKNIGALDIRQGCAGFVYALSVADQFIKTGQYKNILVVGAEVQTPQLDFDNDGRGTAVLFGDGAAVALLSRTENKDKGILSFHLHSDGKFIDELGTLAPSSTLTDIINEELIQQRKHHIHMNGREVFKHAVRRFPEVIQEGLNYNNLSVNDIDLVIPHQANYRITKSVQEQLKIDKSKVFSNIHKYGNTTAASVGIALTEALESGRIKDNNLIALAAFGAGWYWCSLIMRWGK